MSKFLNDLDELVKNNVISKNIANDIQTYYSSQKEESPNKLFAIFGVLGSLLVGLGIILIIAHNWDTFSKGIKTTFAFIPLLLAQLIVGYTILKEKSNTWKEAAGVFLFFTVGASIALISQIYNIPGNVSTFLLTWLLLCLPLVYLLKSNALAILHLVFSTYYVLKAGYFTGSYSPWKYFLLIAFIIPFYLNLLKNSPKQNIASVLNWLFPISLTMAMGAFIDTSATYGFLMYIILFGLFYNIGKIPFFNNDRLRKNGYLIIGSLGTISVLIMMSFKSFWKEIIRNDHQLSQEVYIAAILFVAALSILIYSFKKKWVHELNLFRYVFIIMAVLLFIGFGNLTIPTVLSNILILFLGLIAIKIGSNKMHFGILNYGLLIITALVIARFFDTNLSFVVRGLLFIGVGVGFFVTNYLMLKKQRTLQKKI